MCSVKLVLYALKLASQFCTELRLLEGSTFVFFMFSFGFLKVPLTLILKFKCLNGQYLGKGFTFRKWRDFSVPRLSYTHCGNIQLVDTWNYSIVQYTYFSKKFWCVFGVGYSCLKNGLLQRLRKLCRMRPGRLMRQILWDKY